MPVEPVDARFNTQLSNLPRCTLQCDRLYICAVGVLIQLVHAARMCPLVSFRCVRRGPFFSFVSFGSVFVRCASIPSFPKQPMTGLFSKLCSVCSRQAFRYIGAKRMETFVFGHIILGAVCDSTPCCSCRYESCRRCSRSSLSTAP